MYPEFIAIYVGLAIVIALLVTILVILLKRTSGGGQRTSTPQPTNWMPNAPGAVVFCKYCGTQFDSSQNCCPKCGNFR
ncbi:MAG: hypothetical protein IJB84_07780 [Lachnospiraceae bacterium]|nr:hypothetical protein [Lachnospiraceae bacterium]